MWLVLRVDIENKLKNPAFDLVFFFTYSLIVQHKVNDSAILPL